jgi:hypothetical protein
LTGDGSGLTNVNSDSGSWVNGTGNVYLSTTTDKVGIGTTDPPCLLTIDGGTGVDSSGGVLCIKQKGDTVNDGITLTSSHSNSTRMYKDGNGHFNLHNTGGGSFLIENVTGNVGIGGRTVGLLAPLHVSIPGGLDYGGYTNTPLDMSKDMFRIGNRIANNPTYDHNEYGIQFGVSGSGNSSIQTYVYNHSTTSTTASYSLLLQPNGGNVGIGTTSPQAPFHVYPINGTMNAENTFIDFRREFSPHGHLGIFATETHTNAIGPDLRFKGAVYNGTSNPTINQVICLKPTGKVGIGQTSPIAKLDIKYGSRTGTTPTHNMAFYVTMDLSAEHSGPEIRHSNQSQGIGFGYQSIYATGSNTNQEIKIISRGSSNVFIKNYAVYSDDRIKTNEQYITNAMKTLLKLKPQIYDKHEKINEICDNPTREAGLIAQDVYYDAPELRYLISARNDGIDDGPVNIPEEKPFVDDDPTKDPDYSGWGNASAGIAYIQFVPYLIKAVQEIHEDLQTTRSEIEGDLQTTHTQLEGDLQTTQTQLGDTQTQLETTRTELEHALEAEKVKTKNLESRLAFLETAVASLIS